MGKIDELIQQYCPDGVEFVPLSSISELVRGKVISKDYIKDNEGDYPVYSSQSADDGVMGRIDTYMYDGDYITWTTDGAYAGTIFRRSGKFNITNVCGLVKVISKEIILDFLYYWLYVEAPKYVYRGMGNPKLMSNVMGTISIPLPPLPVQEAIVNILDRFAVYAAELQAELQARQQQYNYYRDTLLSFEGRDDVQWKKLGEVCIYAKERIGANLMDENNYVSVENLLPNQRGKEKASNVPKEGNCIKFEPNDVLVGNIRPYLHKIWYADCVGGTNGDVLCIRIKDDAKSVIIPRYLYCILSSHSFFEYDNSYSKGAKMPRGDKKKVMEYEFGIPSLSEQQYIVDILDRFDTLVNDLSQGLPAEIEARQQQYEYYRDQLLTFKRKEA